MIDDSYERGKQLLHGSYTQYTPDGKSNFVKDGAYGLLPKKGAWQYNYIPSKGRVGHVAIVYDCTVDYNKRVFTAKTIEGNTSAQEWQSNGGMVAFKEYKNIPFDSVGKGTSAHIDGFGYPDYRYDTCTPDELIDVAKREVGYIEKATSSNNGDPNTSATDKEKTANKGLNNYTKYGKWMKSNGVQWCAQFASWCAWFACKKHLESQHSGWFNDGYDWYYSIGGDFIRNQWLCIADRWYVFDGAGRMITKWFEGEGQWYYLNPDDGAMLADQWLQDASHWYYLTHSGVMAKNAYVYDFSKKKYCYVDEAGVWNCDYVDHPGLGAEVIR